MDWQKLFLSAQGRIGQKDFWIGFAILFVANLVLGMIPILGMLISLALIYPNVCVYAKRLHDFGKTGWLILAPIGITFLLGIIAGVVGGGAMMAAASSGGDSAGMAAMFGSMGIFLLIIFIVNIAFLLWVGLTKGDPATNQYGPPPTGAAADEMRGAEAEDDGEAIVGDAPALGEAGAEGEGAMLRPGIDAQVVVVGRDG